MQASTNRNTQWRAEVSCSIRIVVSPETPYSAAWRGTYQNFLCQCSLSSPHPAHQSSRYRSATVSWNLPHLLLIFLQGLDALMLALQKWNGGVIIISHDERFITTVADQVVSAAEFLEWTSCWHSHSSGFVVMELSRNSGETCKVTRQMFSCANHRRSWMSIPKIPESHCQQHQSKTVGAGKI